MILKRNFVLWLVLGLAFFVFAAGGCGGSSSSSSSAPANWADMSGRWAPTEGRILFFSSTGGNSAAFNMVEDDTASVDVVISGAENLYDVTNSSGRLVFSRASGNYQDMDEITTRYSSFDGAYTVSGGSLTKSNSDDGEWVKRVIQYVDRDNVTVVLERGYDSAPSISRRKATVKFVRID